MVFEGMEETAPYFLEAGDFTPETTQIDPTA